MPWRSVSVMEEKEEFILHFKSGKYTVSALAQMFDISRPTAYKFIHRYETAGLSGLLELSRRPRTNPNQTPDRIEEEILRLRNRHPRWGAPKLAVLLEDRFPGITVPAVSTISAILKRNGMVKERRRRKRVEPVHPIFGHRAVLVTSFDHERRHPSPRRQRSTSFPRRP
jgi:transposase